MMTMRTILFSTRAQSACSAGRRLALPRVRGTRTVAAASAASVSTRASASIKSRSKSSSSVVAFVGGRGSVHVAPRAFPRRAFRFRFLRRGFELRGCFLSALWANWFAGREHGERARRSNVFGRGAFRR